MHVVPWFLYSSKFSNGATTLHMSFIIELFKLKNNTIQYGITFKSFSQNSAQSNMIRPLYTHTHTHTHGETQTDELHMTLNKVH